MPIRYNLFIAIPNLENLTRDALVLISIQVVYIVNVFEVHAHLFLARSLVRFHYSTFYFSHKICVFNRDYINWSLLVQKHTLGFKIHFPYSKRRLPALKIKSYFPSWLLEATPLDMSGIDGS